MRNRVLKLMNGLFALAIAVMNLCAGATAAADRGSPATDAMPKEYRIALTVDPSKPEFSGHVEIDVDLPRPLQLIGINGRKLAVSHVSIRQGASSVEGTYSELDEAGDAQIRFPRLLAKGVATVSFDYDAPFQEIRAGLFHGKVNGQWFALSYFVPTNARRAFPSFDHINLKVPYTVTLIAPAGMMAVSNMPELSQSAENGWVRHVFAKSPPLPTYLVGFSVGPFASLEGTIAPTAERSRPIPLRVLLPPAEIGQGKFALDNTAKIIQLLEDFYAVPYPFPKLDMIGQLRITLPKRVATGERVVATITYGGTPHVALRAPYDSGVVWAKTKEGKTWFGTTTEGHGCDLFWPCLDFPTGKPGEVALHITVPKGLKAPSNGRLIGVDTLSDGRTLWNWLVHHPNTYGIALNVGPYEEISGTYQSRFGNRIPMYYWYLPGEEQQARGLFSEFAPALDYLEQQIGPYPFGDEKVGVVETPYMGMEHQTINGYGFHYAKSSEGFDGLFFHELSHEYFANQLTAADWDDMWLHEGYASYMRPLYGLWREGNARYLAILLSQRDEITNKVPVVSGKSRSGSELDDPVTGPGQDVYVKASWMLHTLRHLIGDRDFWTITRLAVYGRTDPKPGNFVPRFGSTREYEALVRQVTGKDYAWFFDVYLRQAQLQELIVTRDGGRLKVSWRVPGGLPFPMPVEVQVDGRLRYLKMVNGSETIVVPPSAHVVLDPEARVLKQSDAADNYRKWKEGLRT